MADYWLHYFSMPVQKYVKFMCL